jgi:hypothetical protein
MESRLFRDSYCGVSFRELDVSLPGEMKLALWTAEQEPRSPVMSHGRLAVFSSEIAARCASLWLTVP